MTRAASAHVRAARAPGARLARDPPRRHVALGIQRLRIIDLETGDQPIYNEDGSVAVVLNGEIYNFRELRARARARGHTLRARRRHRGDRPPLRGAGRRLRATACSGMFAFALWDARRRRLLLARDRVGKKPLFYALRDGVAGFASELKALLGDDEMPREVDHEALDAYLRYGYVPAPLTRFRGVRKLPPAHTLRLADGQVDDRALLAARLRDASVRRDRVEELCERDPRRAARGDAAPPDRRRAARRVPVGRHRLVRRRGRDGASSRASPCRRSRSASTTRRSTSCPTRAGSPSGSGPTTRSSMVRADAVEILPKLVRHYGEPFADSSAIPSFYLVRADAPPRHRGAERRRRRRELRRLQALRRERARRRLDRCRRAAPRSRRSGCAAARRRSGRESAEPGAPARGGSRSTAPRATRLRLVVRPGRAPELYTPIRGRRPGLPPSEVIAASWAGASGETVVDLMLEVDVDTYLPDDLWRRSTSRPWPTRSRRARRCSTTSSWSSPPRSPRR